VFKLSCRKNARERGGGEFSHRLSILGWRDGKRVLMEKINKYASKKGGKDLLGRGWVRARQGEGFKKRSMDKAPVFFGEREGEPEKWGVRKRTKQKKERTGYLNSTGMK